MDASVSLVAAAAALAVMGFTWLASLAVRDASLADIAWGMAFVLIGWACYLAGDRSGAMLLAACLVTVWGLRLAIHIGRRNLGHGEDRAAEAIAREPLEEARRHRAQVRQRSQRGQVLRIEPEPGDRIRRRVDTRRHQIGPVAW